MIKKDAHIEVSELISKLSYKLNKKEIQSHPYHLVTPSPWPLLTSLAALCFTFGMVLFMQRYEKSVYLVFPAFTALLAILTCWWRDVVREGTFEGQHTQAVVKGLKLGMILFIVSEIMFFFAFFWAFFHSALNPVYNIGAVWPPYGITTLDPWSIPLLNTIILLNSGMTLTYSHYCIRAGLKKKAVLSLLFTIVLAVYFTMLQYLEYVNAPFTISDSVYGSVFFMITGFHGFHVIIGTLFLTVCLVRLNRNHFAKKQHLGFEAAAWYWHFVDVVWILVFLIVYLWGS